MRRFRFTPLMVLGLVTAGAAEAGPADGLLRLVSADSGVTLTIEDFRSRSREVAGSPLFEAALRLPSVRNWMASDRFRKVEKSSRDVMAALGVTPATLRDEILGDAVVLTLEAGPVDRPEQSTGLLLVKVRDLAMAGRMIKAFNDAQHHEGELVHVEDRMKGQVRYSARFFKAGGRPPEFYALLDDGTFAWSNSEAMILGVVDRKVSGRAGLAEDPGFRKVRGSLPDRALASLYFNPRFLERAMAGSPRPADDRASAMIARYLGAIGQLGLAVEWRDGVMLHSSESVDAGKLDPWLRAWLARPPSPVVLPAQVSPSTVAIVSANLDFPALGEGVLDLVAEDDRPPLDNLKLGFQGLLMGRDPLKDVLPRLVPGAIATLEIDPGMASRPHFPLVGVVGWSVPPGSEDLSGPIDNAMRTLLAFYAFDPKRRMDRLRVEPRSIGDARLTLLTDGLRTLLAYRVDRDRIVLGNSPEAVARFGAGPAPSMFSEVRARYFPESETFAIVDLTRLAQEVRGLRGPMARALAARSNRPVAAAARDLGDLLAVAELFKAATFTTAAARDASEIRRTIGLLAR